MTTVKLENLGKGEKKIGVNNKMRLSIPHPSLPIAHTVTFWSVITVDFKEKDIPLETAVELLTQLKERESEKGKFLVWQP